VTAGLGEGAVRDLAARHGIRPSRALGQHFLVDPNLARSIVAHAGVGPRSRVVEVGAGLGSLTLPLAETGAEVLAVEFDRELVNALGEVVGDRPNVRVLAADATMVDWSAELPGEGWTWIGNLPYNVAVPILDRALAGATTARRFVAMVQREVGDRVVAGPGDEAYGPLALRVAWHGNATVLRGVPREVFWPRPAVASVVVAIDRHEQPPVDADPETLWRVVDAGFATRRKTIRAALRSITPDAGAVLERAAVDPGARAERLDLSAFARIAGSLA